MRSLMSGSSHGTLRRARPRAEDQLRRVAVAGLLTDPLADLLGDRAVLGDVGAAVRARSASFIASGIEWVTKSRWASRRAASARSASAVRVASTIGSTKPGVVEVVAQPVEARRAPCVLGRGATASARFSRYCRHPEYDE